MTRGERRRLRKETGYRYNVIGVGVQRVVGDGYRAMIYPDDKNLRYNTVLDFATGNLVRGYNLKESPNEIDFLGVIFLRYKLDNIEQAKVILAKRELGLIETLV